MNNMIGMTTRVGCALLVILAGGCRGSVGPVPSGAPDITGRVASNRFEVASTGPGGLSRLWLGLDSRRAAGLPASVQVVIDSATRFVELSDRKLDWRLPELRGAYVRIWFANGHSTPTDADFVARARLVVIDSMGPPVKDVPFPTEHRATTH